MEKDHLEIILEDILGKFDLVLEGHDMLRNEIREVQQESNARHDHTAFLLNALNDKIDGVDARLSNKIDGVEASLSNKIDGVEASLNNKIDGVDASLGSKIDAVAADLKAHRADTESHHGVYRVKEG